MIRELGTLRDRLVEICPGTPKLLHLSAQLVHRLKEQAVRGRLGVLNVKKRKALIVKLAVKLQELFERSSGLLL